MCYSTYATDTRTAQNGQKGSRIICIELYIQCDDQFGSSATCVSTFKIKESDWWRRSATMISLYYNCIL